MTARRQLASDLKLMLEIAGVEKMPDVEYMAALILEGFTAGAYRDDAVDRALTATGPGSGWPDAAAFAATIFDPRWDYFDSVVAAIQLRDAQHCETAAPQTDTAATGPGSGAATEATEPDPT